MYHYKAYVCDNRRRSKPDYSPSKANGENGIALKDAVRYTKNANESDYMEMENEKNPDEQLCECHHNNNM